MSFDAVPVGLFFVITVAIVMLAIEGGYQLGSIAHRRAEDEKESPVSSISGSILALLAFVLAFTFAIVSDRYDARKGLVREEANAIRIAYLRSDFLPEGDRGEAAALLKEYLDVRLAAVQSGDLEKIGQALIRTDQIQTILWDMAVENARIDMNSDVAALYIESLNEMAAVNANRVSIGLQVRIPTAIWLVLLVLIIIGMLGVGYQTAIAGSRRSWATLALAISFSVVITLIALLDRPASSALAVSQQPLENLQVWMEAQSAVE